MLIAPVEVGDSAYTGAGAVIKDDVPDGALAVSENEQRNIDGYAADKAAKMREDARRVSTIEQQPAGRPTAIPHDYSKRMMVFGGRSSRELAAKVAGKLDLDLGQVTLKTFANGEVYCRYEESIRGADVFIVQSTCANEQTGMTPNDALIELLTMIDAAQGASAHRIIAVHALVRLRPPGQEVGPARADHGPDRRQVPRGASASTASSPWTSTPARSRASSTSRSTT